jgi:LPS-assembly lipoprotein
MSSSDRRQFLALLAVAPLGGLRLSRRSTARAAAAPCRGGWPSRHRTPAGLQPRFPARGPYRPRQWRAYLLTYRIETSESALALSDTDDINRINVSGTIAYAVTETASGVQVQVGEVSTFTAYASSGSPVATAAARRDAQERLMIALADQIVARLLAGADAWA